MKNNAENRVPAAWDRRSTRRSFNRGLLAASLLPVIKPAFAAPGKDEPFDYIVVGAGAGGGPVAARLAREGFKVALLEAGLDPLGQGSAIDPTTGIIYQVPAFAAVAAEDPLLSWAFYVKHYANAAQQARDPKYVENEGILYPRGSALGGSTAHDAMIFMYPHDDDWDDIAEATGDNSWRAPHMRSIFERLEHCDYCEPGAPGHGFKGYMPASLFDLRIFENYPILKDLAEAGQQLPISDINSPPAAKGEYGTFNTPINVATRVRISIREHLIATQKEFPDRLFIITGALAAKILIKGKRVHGVEFLQGINLYEADKLYNPRVTPEKHSIYAKREVILSTGVFNTPQLLKLSGIGPAKELMTHGIDVVSDLPGVGANLQDRYELAVNVQLNEDIELYTRCKPNQPTDPCIVAWATGKWEGISSPFFGPYANNAAYAARVAKSNPVRELPDLFLVGQATSFHGFFPGFSQMAFGRVWTWLILKAYATNTAGTVTLRSLDPRKMPEINFHYFEEGNGSPGEDMDAVVKAVKLARKFTHDPQAAQHITKETYPGAAIQSDCDLRQFIRDNAWGHHASCTAKIGGDEDPMAVLDSSFRVRGVKGLRVVDACALPRLPGFFPVCSILMLGEKAGDVIVENSKSRDNDDM